MNPPKLKVKDVLLIQSTPEAREALRSLGIHRKTNLAKVTITQVAEVGVSFKFNRDIIQLGESAHEFHINADSVKPVFAANI